MAKVNVEILGLKDLQEVINPKRINKQLAIDVAKQVLVVHNTMRQAVHKRYTKQNDIQKQLIRKISLVDTGRHLIRNGLVYRIKYSDLSKFPYSVRWGNINPGAKRRGLVHSVEVVRGRKRVITGERHLGGFTPRKGQRIADNSIGTPISFRGHGSQMLERVGADKSPTELLLGPSTQTMVLWAYYNDESTKQAINNIENNLLDTYF